MTKIPGRIEKKGADEICFGRNLGFDEGLCNGKVYGYNEAAAESNAMRDVVAERLEEINKILTYGFKHESSCDCEGCAMGTLINELIQELKGEPNG